MTTSTQLGDYSEGLFSEEDIKRAARGWNLTAFRLAALTLIAGVLVGVAGSLTAPLDSVSDELFAAAIGGLLALAAIVPAGYGLLANRASTRIHGGKILWSGWLGGFSYVYVGVIFVGLLLGLLALLYGYGWAGPPVIAATITAAAWSPLILYWLAHRLGPTSSTAYVVATASRTGRDADTAATKALLKDLRDVALSEVEEGERRAVKARLRGLATLATQLPTSLSTQVIDELGYVLTVVVDDRDLARYGMDVLWHAHQHGLADEAEQKLLSELADVWAVSLTRGASPQVKYTLRDLFQEALDEGRRTRETLKDLQNIREIALELNDQRSLNFLEHVSIRALARDDADADTDLVRFVVRGLVRDRERARRGARRLIATGSGPLLQRSIIETMKLIRQSVEGSDDPPPDGSAALLVALIVYPSWLSQEDADGADSSWASAEAVEELLRIPTVRDEMEKLHYPLIVEDLVQTLHTAFDHQGGDEDERDLAAPASLLAEILTGALAAHARQDAPEEAQRVALTFAGTIADKLVTSQFQRTEHPLWGEGVHRRLAGKLQWLADRQEPTAGSTPVETMALHLLPLFLATGDERELSYARAWLSLVGKLDSIALESWVDSLAPKRSTQLYRHVWLLQEEARNEGDELPAGRLLDDDPFFEDETWASFLASADAVLTALATSDDLRTRQMHALAGLRVGDTVSGHVVGIHDYGAFVDVGGVNGLLHWSEMDLARDEEPPDVLGIDDRVDVVVLRSDVIQGEADLSTCALEWDAFRESDPVGELIDVEVVRTSEDIIRVRAGAGPMGVLPWEEYPSDPKRREGSGLARGDHLRVRVTDLDDNRMEFECSRDGAWQQFCEEIAPGDQFEATVASLASFGAFVETQWGYTGLIHISEIGEGWLRHPEDVLAVGDGVRVRLIRRDDTKREMSLALVARLD